MGRRRNDKECAQQMVAIAQVVGDNKELGKAAMERTLTRDEMARGGAYIESGKKVSGPTR